MQESETERRGNNRFINFAVLDEQLENLSQEFESKVPFSHVVVDNFISDYGLECLKPRTLMENKFALERSSDFFLFASEKYENPKIEEISHAFSQLKEELLSQEFQNILRAITKRDVFVDPSFTGGGLHQGAKGSFLEMHSDFSHHPENKRWLRELNILIYLNSDWKEDWGGCLDLLNSETGVTGSIAPVLSRAVIMLTKKHTVHGYKKINFPKNLKRTSIAAYAYSIDTNKKTNYRSTHGNLATRRILICYFLYEISTFGHDYLVAEQ